MVQELVFFHRMAEEHAPHPGAVNVGIRGQVTFEIDRSDHQIEEHGDQHAVNQLLVNFAELLLAGMDDAPPQDEDVDRVEHVASEHGDIVGRIVLRHLPDARLLESASRYHLVIEEQIEDHQCRRQVKKPGVDEFRESVLDVRQLDKQMQAQPDDRNPRHAEPRRRDDRAVFNGQIMPDEFLEEHGQAAGDDAADQQILRSLAAAGQHIHQNVDKVDDRHEMGHQRSDGNRQGHRFTIPSADWGCRRCSASSVLLYTHSGRFDR